MCVFAYARNAKKLGFGPSVQPDRFNNIYYKAKANSQVKDRQGSEPGISLKTGEQVQIQRHNKGSTRKAQRSKIAGRKAQHGACTH